MQKKGSNNDRLSPGVGGDRSIQTRISRRLINYLAAKDKVVQVALITWSDRELQLEMVAPDALDGLPKPLSEAPSLPVDLIQRVLFDSSPGPVALATQQGLSGLIYPLIENGFNAGALYVVSPLSAIELRRQLDKLEPVRSLLTMTLMQTWQHK